jgi:hypothetical protein
MSDAGRPVSSSATDPSEFFALGGTFAAIVLLGWLLRSFVHPAGSVRRLLVRIAPNVVARLRLPEAAVGGGGGGAAAAGNSPNAASSPPAGGPTPPWRSLASSRRAEIERVAPEFAYGKGSWRRLKKISANSSQKIITMEEQQTKPENGSQRSLKESNKKVSDGQNHNHDHNHDRATMDRDDDDDGDDDVFCVVCLDEMEEGDAARKLPCGHTYHAACVLAWLAKHNVCPLCMREVVRKEKRGQRSSQPPTETADVNSSVSHTALPMSSN